MVLHAGYINEAILDHSSLMSLLFAVGFTWYSIWWFNWWSAYLLRWCTARPELVLSIWLECWPVLPLDSNWSLSDTSLFSGSLGTSVFDSDVYLVGASGGVYALLAAHLANIMLNYNHMESGLLRLLAVLVVGMSSAKPSTNALIEWLQTIASSDVGIAIYDRYCHQIEVSYVAHLTGALAGLTIGLIVLKNFEQKLHEQLIWWIALGVYTACIVFAVLYNVYHWDQKFQK